MAGTHWEVGGEFHSPVETPRPFHPWPRPAVWYALGRHAVEEVAAFVRARTVWVPDYFCHEVAVGWEQRFEVRTYEDDPRWLEPAWDTVGARRGDVVVAVNHFGAREDPAWAGRVDGATLVEDHSHDPFSPWAVASEADYAFSSLRKTLPVPDGGILWSPRGLDLPPQPRGAADGSELKLAAMLLKGRFLEGGGGDDGLKDRFRRLQLDGEELLSRAPVAAASSAAREAVIGGAPLPWRVRRSDNAVHLLGALAALRVAEPLFDEWPAGAAPLGVVLVFESEEARDTVRESLRLNGVYCPVHWRVERPASDRVRELAARVLTVPTDWRYSAEDMERVASLLLDAESRV